MGLDNAPNQDNNDRHIDKRHENPLPRDRPGDLTNLSTPHWERRYEGALELLKEYFSSLVAEQFGKQRELRDEQVQRHFVAVLMANIRDDYFHDALSAVDKFNREPQHRFPQAARLAKIIECCANLERTSRDPEPIADLYIFLGDQVVFLKGMFHPRNLELALDLSATALPKRANNLAEVAQIAYDRASDLSATNAGPNADSRSSLFKRLSDNVVYCINGLRQVRTEINFQSYGLRGR